MKIKVDLYLKELLLFGATLALGAFSAYKYSLSPVLVDLPEFKFNWSDAIFLAGAMLFILFASKYKTILPTEKELISFIEQENREMDFGK